MSPHLAPARPRRAAPLHLLALSLLLGTLALVTDAAAQTADDAPRDDDPVDASSARAASRLVGLEFTDDELGQMLGELRDVRRRIIESREDRLGFDDLPALRFDPLAPGVRYRPSRITPVARPVGDVTRPADPEDLAFADLATLSALVRTRQVSCVELTTFFLDRLRTLDPQLHCVVSLTEERALAQAEALDAELERGAWRGPLHGIPWGAKDLLAVDGTRTTWGAKPYEDQVLEGDATVVQRLDEAGAVLVAKLTLGALAYGDLWFGGRTRNPWDTEQGSSGSSAGPASAVAAGAVPFAIGSETYGSIVSPSNRCGVSSLRPTFGRVSRHGAMPLVWSMDKLGPMARTLDDAALVLDVLHGPDGHDPTVHDLPYAVPGDADVSGLVVGVPKGAFEDFPGGTAVLDDLRALGLELVDVELPDVSRSNLNAMLMAESAAAFDELTRSDRDDLLVWQDDEAWPNLWRATRLLPAVEYVNASRRRSVVMREMDAVMERVDVLVHPPYAVTFTGRLFDETTLLAVAGAWQRATTHHLRRPPIAAR